MENKVKYGAIAGGLIVSLGIAQLLTRIFAAQRTSWSVKHTDELFERYATDYRVRNERYEHLKAHWKLIRQHTVKALTDLGLARLPKIKKREVTSITSWLEQALPELRRKVHLAENAIQVDQQEPAVDTPDDAQSL